MQNSHDDKSQATQIGLVISYFGNSVAVETADGQVFQCYLKRNQPLPVVGDQVEWEREGEEAGRVIRILERHSILARGDVRGKSKILAANVDNLVIVMSPPPVFSAYLLDRYLVAAEILGLHPIIVLNKIDLLNAPELEKVSAELEIYRRIPYPVYLTSIKNHQGINLLSDAFQKKLSVLVGPSGVGKSSIITALTDQCIRVTEVSPKGAGKHTTTATRLYHLAEGGGLIDSPGVRDFNLWAVSKKEILQGFKEFIPYLAGCKFRDCQHVVEPGCKLIEAVNENKVDKQRFENFKVLVKDAT